MENRYFILSTGRSGTTLISKIISRNSEIDLEHQKKGSRVINVLGNLNLLHLFPTNALETFLKKNFGDSTNPYSTSDPLRSIPLYIYLSHNDSQTDNYKVIHLLRDPREFVTSFMNWKNDSLKRRVLHHIVPFWQPSPILENKLLSFDIIVMSKFEHFCWIWNYKNHLFRELNNGRNNYFLLKFEDLIKIEENGNMLEDLSSFMELNLLPKRNSLKEPEKVNPSTEEHFPNWRSWNKKQAQTLQFYCGELMNEYGYGNEEEWKQLIK